MATAVAPKPSTSAPVSAPARSEGQKTYAPQPRFALWKPNREKKGNAAIIEYSIEKGCFFLRMLPESGQESPKFDNSKAITAKLGISDVGEIIAVLTGRREALGHKDEKTGYWSGLYHENANGSSSINLSPGTAGMILGLSVKKDGPPTRYSVGVTPGEQEVLRVFFEKYLGEMFLAQDRASE